MPHDTQFSLNEFATLVRKAASGCGYEHGVAEEAGRFARFLGGQFGDAAALAASFFDGMDMPVPCEAKSRTGSCAADYHFTGGDAISVCCVLSDYAGIAGEGYLRFDGLKPFRRELLVPGLAAFCSYVGVDGEVDLAGEAQLISVLMHEQPDDWIAGAAIDAFSIRALRGTVFEQPAVRFNTVRVPNDDRKALECLASRTYAPETDALRISGAGAGLTDND